MRKTSCESGEYWADASHGERACASPLLLSEPVGVDKSALALALRVRFAAAANKNKNASF
jgi:hypothetical protein